MNKTVKSLAIITLLMLLIPQAIHAEIDGKKLVKESKEAAIYGAPIEEHQIPYVTGPDTTVPHYEGVPVEQVKKDAKEIHERVKNGTYQTEYVEPLPLQLAKRYKPVVVCLINNSLLTAILNFNELEYDIQNMLDDTM